MRYEVRGAVLIDTPFSVWDNYDEKVVKSFEFKTDAEDLVDRLNGEDVGVNGDVRLNFREMEAIINGRFKSFYIETKSTGRKIDHDNSGAFYLSKDEAIKLANTILKEFKVN